MGVFSMPTSFAEFWERSKKTTPYVSTLVGALFISIGTYLYLSQERFERSGKPVFLEVTDMVEGSEGGYAPEFVVVEGADEGRKYRGNTYISPPVHQIGDRVPGLLNPDTGVIKSEGMIARTKWIALFLLLVGTASTLHGFGYALYHRYKSKTK